MAAPTGKGPTTLRAFRLEDEIYDPAQEIAAIRGETVTDVVRRAFVEYVADANADAEIQALKAAGNWPPKRARGVKP